MNAARNLLGCMLVLAGTATCRANLIVNGDFQNGNDGSFTSDYTFVPNNAQNLSTGIYSVGTTPTDVNSFWTNPSSVTNVVPYSAMPAGNMLFVNGSGTPSTVWSETVNLVSGTTYSFTGYVASLFAQNPATLTVTAGSQTLLTTPSAADAPATAGVWSGFQSIFTYNGASGPVALTIVDNSVQGQGNDFALSNLSLNVGSSAVPEPGSVVLFGVGLAGFGLAARRRFSRPAA